jgi:hypothetical protein
MRLMSTQNPPTSPRYVWQHSAWPQLTFDVAALAPALDLARPLVNMAFALREYQFEQDSPERRAATQLAKQLLEPHQLRE